jgi:hypothetical protein
MNSSLWSADVTTHIKIAVVSLIAAILVVTIGVSARISEADTIAVVKAGKPAIFTTNGASTIR